VSAGCCSRCRSRTRPFKSVRGPAQGRKTDLPVRRVFSLCWRSPSPPQPVDPRHSRGPPCRDESPCDRVSTAPRAPQKTQIPALHVIAGASSEPTGSRDPAVTGNNRSVTGKPRRLSTLLDGAVKP
jgi:hypothetical protein